jgi:hypothetical protein
MTPSVAHSRRRAPDSAQDWGEHLADRVVAEVAALAGGRLRAEVSRLLAEVTKDGCAAFLALLEGDERACEPERMQLLVGDLFHDVEISLEDAMALHRHLEHVLWRELQESPPAALRDVDPARLEAVSRRFFNDLAGALADSYLAARRGHDSDRTATEADLLACLLASPPQLGQARRAARALGIDLDVPWEVSVIAPRAGGTVGGGVPARLRRALWGTVVLVGRLEPGLVVAVSWRGIAAEWPDLGPELSTGSGSTHYDVRGLRESYDEALEVLELARRQGLQRLRFDDAWFDRFLTGAVSAEDLAELVLAPLEGLTANRRATVLETLEAYLDCGGSVGGVADALHLHRQTVNYRLQNVRRIFGSMLTTANGRLALHIAVKATRLRGGR